MDINHIKLPVSMIAELFHSLLIEPDGMQANKSESFIQKDNSPAPPDWKFLGENRKNILVLVNCPELPHLPEKDLALLTGILSACKISLDDVAILNFNNHRNRSYKEFLAFFNSKIVLLFAIEPALFGLPLNFPHFQIQPFAGNSFLYSPALSELENDKVLKSKLWVCLKRLFNL